MSAAAPGQTGSPPARGVPLLVTAELPGDMLAWADAFRREHYPPERNRLQAHVTLFHGLPPSSLSEVRQMLGELAGEFSAPDAQVTGLMDLGQGTAFSVESPGMAALHGLMAERLHGIIQQKDTRELRLHITVQNKVERRIARALQAELRGAFVPRGFRFRGFGTYGWDGALWNFEQLFPFRGTAPAADGAWSAYGG